MSAGEANSCDGTQTTAIRKHLADKMLLCALLQVTHNTAQAGKLAAAIKLLSCCYLLAQS